MSTLALWNRYMCSYDFLNEVDSYSHNLSDIAEAIDLRPGMRVLDAGSGTGNLSMLLKGRGLNVLSCDFSPAALEVHRKKDPQAEQLEASLEQPLKLEDLSFDAVCCASVLFALSQRGCQTAVGEFFRVLKPGGRLVVTVVAPDQRNGNLIGMHFKGLQARYGRTRGLVRGMQHVPALLKVLYYNRLLGKLPDWQGFHRFSQEELSTLLLSSGFETVEIQRTYGGCFFLAVARKPG
jgi:ubiquinone/menaquinone biosynthesis C-methylase UbiE